MRGEDQGVVVSPLGIGGSPPHARGRRPACRASSRTDGITPACAGKTNASISDRPSRRDHPRMRGEDLHVAENDGGVRGSPPHARGRLGNTHSLRSCQRITPACAGKTTTHLAGATGRRDHPRMRGEDRERSTLSARCRGSPPHARGRPSQLRRLAFSCRITPACAGKTRTSPYPQLFGNGSPPHARGRHKRFDPGGHVLRITPACAGKTAFFKTVIGKF